MKRFLMLLLCVMLMLWGCKDADDPVATTTVPPTTTEPAPDAAAIYTEAAQALADSQNLTLRVTTQQTMTVAGVSYQDSTLQTIRIHGYGTDSMTATLEENTTYSSFWAQYDEVFVDNTVYVFSQNAHDDYTFFSGDMTAENYAARIVPPVLLDASLYAGASIDGKTITFTDASAPESWTNLEVAAMEQACGRVILNGEGRIIRYDYEISYHYGPADFVTTTSVIVDTKTALTPATAPTGNYTHVEFPDAGRILDRALGRISQSNQISATLTETILCQAAGYMRSAQVDTHTYGHADQFMGIMDMTVALINGESTKTYTQTHHLQNSTYTISTDGEVDKKYAGTDPDDFRRYIEGTVGDWNLYISAGTASQGANIGGIYYVALELSEDWALAQCDYVNRELFNDENMLDSYATAYQTDLSNALIAIDSITGFPTAISTVYSGTHTIQGVPCMLTYQIDYTFELASQSAYEAITGEPLPMTEPTEKATPLFYHVTGDNGQEMWLFGTIHVGDSRTCYLPQKIYDAFDSADALAVEFNIENFYAMMETDEELQKLAAEAYYYTDGTTAEDHIATPELFDYATKLMKATGNFNTTTPFMKPSLWSNIIENTYLRMGYRLSSDLGIDNLLMERARQQQKEILDVESGIAQLQILGGFSDALQEYILMGTLSGTAVQYQEDVLALFEMWCEGDEQKLTAYLNEEKELPDTSSLTEAELEQYNKELALYKEYNEAMSSSRNVDMVDVAIGYLESDKVVFYAVGLAHLLAEDGLVNALRDAGYTVEPVTFP